MLLVVHLLLQRLVLFNKLFVCKDHIGSAYHILVLYSLMPWCHGAILSLLHAVVLNAARQSDATMA